MLYEQRASFSTFAVTVFLQFRLLQVRMQLHLVDSWCNLGCLQQFLCLGDTEVGDTNGSSQTLRHTLLHHLEIVSSKVREVEIGSKSFAYLPDTSYPGLIIAQFIFLLYV